MDEQEFGERLKQAGAAVWPVTGFAASYAAIQAAADREAAAVIAAKTGTVPGAADKHAARLAGSTVFSYSDWRQALALIGNGPDRDRLARVIGEAAERSQGVLSLPQMAFMVLRAAGVSRDELDRRVIGSWNSPGPLAR
jgi:hypothetical protein